MPQLVSVAWFGWLQSCQQRCYVLTGCDYSTTGKIGSLARRCDTEQSRTRWWTSVHKMQQRSIAMFRQTFEQGKYTALFSHVFLREESQTGTFPRIRSPRGLNFHADASLSILPHVFFICIHLWPVYLVAADGSPVLLIWIFDKDKLSHLQEYWSPIYSGAFISSWILIATVAVGFVNLQLGCDSTHQTGG